MNQESSLDMRASPVSVMAVEAALSVPLLICVVAALREPSMWGPVLLILLGQGFLMVWLKSHRICITNRSITYSSLFSGSRSVPLQDIERAQIEIGYARYRDRLKPPVRLVIHLKSETETKPISINLRLFKRADVDRLLSILRVEE